MALPDRSVTSPAGWLIFNHPPSPSVPFLVKIAAETPRQVRSPAIFSVCGKEATEARCSGILEAWIKFALRLGPRRITVVGADEAERRRQLTEIEATGQPRWTRSVHIDRRPPRVASSIFRRSSVGGRTIAPDMTPRTLRAVGGGSAAGPFHSRHFAAACPLVTGARNEPAAAGGCGTCGGVASTAVTI